MFFVALCQTGRGRWTASLPPVLEWLHGYVHACEGMRLERYKGSRNLRWRSVSRAHPFPVTSTRFSAVVWYMATFSEFWGYAVFTAALSIANTSTGWCAGQIAALLCG